MTDASSPRSRTRATADSASFSVSLERGLRILSAFGGDRSVLGIADLARAVGLNKSTTYRYVATLAKLEYIRQDPETKKYFLGPRVIDLGFAAIDSMELTKVAGPLLQALADETGFTVSMGLCDGPDVVYVDRRRSGRRSPLAMDLNLHVGSRLPAYCTSMGKVLLAYKDPAALRQILDRTEMARRGPKTITNREQFLAALAKVRQSAVAVNDEELAPGLRSFAAPVRDRSGGVVAAVNVAVHLTMSPTSVEALSGRVEPSLRRAAAEISRRLGYRG
ncbi:IclR family transcriptional regulator C-terminal domain-containing protein [Spongiactinospora sp. TRM90649]|uniref:IclR family transcriptional regulator n=1 Tax=Spongiactinospora sp. TRM90649 TaxID=3031114 RepID=UPI0023F75703|nr:IclR family transcriptional regulator C-terminal domain-containing protein [Spongiactinospora sp. TRM90649]MDF5756894.1 IclR family transcriptional regulator C-terminal domain-containing protein [Spongiactinospora sp. TRM90649]